ncbi:MAG: MoaD/ThiS family protein, partial [Planctomycetaceae bacterium]
EIEAGSLREACLALERRFPELADDCLNDGALKAGYLANVNGAEFTTDPHRTLRDGDTLLILSADVGG